MQTILTNLGIIAASIILVLGNRFVKFIETKLAKVKDSKKMEKSIDIGLKINRCLDEIRIKTGADRVHIFGYHNGTIGFNGVSFKYLSMIAESVGDEIAPIIKDNQSVPCGTYWELINRIQQNAVVRILEKEDSVIGRLHRSFGVQDCYKFRIGDNISNGSLSITYHHEVKDLTQEEISTIQDKLVKIDMLLKSK